MKDNRSPRSKDDVVQARQRYKEVQDAARKLRRNPAWSPEQASQKHMQRLQAKDAHYQREKVYAHTSFCADCAALREESGDESHLCELHLREILGM